MNNEPSEDKDCSGLAAEPAALDTSGVSGWQEPSLLPHAKEPFEADRTDVIFALFAFILGYCFAHWVLFSWQGWGVTLSTLGYCGTVTVYLLNRFAKMDLLHYAFGGWVGCSDALHALPV